MLNVMLDDLPVEYDGCIVNTDFRIGIQLTLLSEDEEFNNRDKQILVIELLFSNDDGTLRKFPQDLDGCIQWYLNGWYLDNQVKPEEAKKKLMDYDIDQWRIYADFLQIYHIDLATTQMHWWMFQGLLWNMPHERSSFLQTLELRQKKPRKGASAEEKKAIEMAHKRYDLKQTKKEVVFTQEEITKIDDYDSMMAKIKEEKAKNKRLKELIRGG